MIVATQEVNEYVDAVPEERRAAVGRLVEVVRERLPEGFAETMGYRMPAWVVPHSRYPAGYHCDPTLPLPFLNVANQKGHVALYHMGVYADEALLSWFEEAWADAMPTTLNMGKSCIRFTRPDAIPFGLIGDLVSRMDVDGWIERYESAVRR